MTNFLIVKFISNSNCNMVRTIKLANDKKVYHGVLDPTDRKSMKLQRSVNIITDQMVFSQTPFTHMRTQSHICHR